MADTAASVPTGVRYGPCVDPQSAIVSGASTRNGCHRRPGQGLHRGNDLTAHPDLVVVQPTGEIEAVGNFARNKLRSRAGEYHLTVGMSGLLVLSQDGSPGTVPGSERILMAGEIISASLLVDLISMIAAQRWHCALQIFSRGCHRVLLFDQGALKFAHSTNREDRLDQIFLALGIVRPEDLGTVQEEIDRGRKFGEILVERGIVDHDQLFEGLQTQMQQIFFSTLMLGEGRYLVTLPDLDTDAPPVTVHLPVDSMLLQGVERLDEMSLMKKLIPHLNVVPMVRDASAETPSDDTERLVLHHCDGMRTLASIIAATGLDEYQCMRAVYVLLERGVIGVEPKSLLHDDVVRDLLGRFNEVLEEIFTAARSSDHLDGVQAQFSAWIQAAGYANYFGDGIAQRGRIEADSALELLRQIYLDRPMQFLHQALHEVVSFALFTVTTMLPHREERALSQRVNQMLAAIGV